MQGSSWSSREAHWTFLMAQWVKNPLANTGAMDSIPGSRRSPEGGNGNPLRYSCLKNPVDSGAWRASAWGRKESDRTEQLSTQPVLTTNFFLPLPPTGLRLSKSQGSIFGAFLAHGAQGFP